MISLWSFTPRRKPRFMPMNQREPRLKVAKIKGSNIYTVERGPKVHDAKANEMDKKASAKLMLQKSAGGKSSYRKSSCI